MEEGVKFLKNLILTLDLVVSLNQVTNLSNKVYQEIQVQNQRK